MYDTLLFDLDGTLTDPFEGITNSVLYALKKCGIDERDRRKLAAFIGPPLLDSFRTYYNMDDAQARRALAFYREYYADKGIFENRVYASIPETLAALAARGKRLYVATSKPEYFARKVLGHFSLGRFFSGVAGASMDETRTDKAEVIAYALEKFSLSGEHAVMIGDRKHDVIGAKKNGLPCIGVLYGFGSREELLAAGADALAKTPEDLISLV